MCLFISWLPKFRLRKVQAHLRKQVSRLESKTKIKENIWDLQISEIILFAAGTFHIGVNPKLILKRNFD